jgi:16S rRNA G966 N2-methylase RsmD
MSKQKLELTWIGKEKRPRLEPRILLEDPEKSYHAKHRVTENDLFDNRLIFGDNLLALKALEAEFAGKVKCVFIDPPYNTGSAFTHYDDGLEHSIWLGLMRDRLEIIRRLLAEDGSLWITIDDNEAHYLKVLCDEVFGRANFVANIVWQKKYSKQNDAKWLQIATNPGDLVLDSFAGSGTTGAVAHKMGRRWIMVELGEHCHTHIIPRLQKVIDGEDKGGITQAVGWQGGGGFRYYRLAPSLIVDDRWGNPVINPEYNAAQLAEALAKLEGFAYAPSETHWWQHGHSSERDFIYVTTQNLSADQLQALSEEVGAERSLLVCCSAFHGVTAAQAAERWPNLTLKKIPKMVLARCEWGHDDYSLNVANLPMAQPAPQAPSPRPSPGGRGSKAAVHARSVR